MFVAQLDACTGPNINEEPDTGNQENTAQSVTVNELLSSSETLYGTGLTVAGGATEEIAPLAFELDGGLSDGVFAYWTSQPLIVATSVEPTDNTTASRTLP